MSAVAHKLKRRMVPPHYADDRLYVEQWKSFLPKRGSNFHPKRKKK